MRQLPSLASASNEVVPTTYLVLMSTLSVEVDVHANLDTDNNARMRYASTVRFERYPYTVDLKVAVLRASYVLDARD